jgi:O-antigen/teichoic acid export membrane protein
MSQTKEKSYRSYFLTLLSGNALSQIIPFLIIPFITRIFTKDEIASSANWLSFAGLIGILATGRLDVAIPLPKSNKEARFIYSSGLIITAIVTLLSCTVLFFTKEIALWYKDESLENTIWLIPIGVASAGLLGITSNWALRNRKYRKVSIGKIAQSIVNNAGAVLLGYYAFGVLGLIVAWIVSQFINILMLLDSDQPRRNLWVSKIDIAFFKRIIKKYKEFPLINSLHAFTDVLATQFLLFYFISVYFSKEELALYYLMFRYVRAPISLVSGSVYQLYYIEANKSIHNHGSGMPIAIKTVKTIALFAVPFVILLISLGPSVFGVYLGSEWREAGVYAQIFAPMFFLFFFTSPLSGTPLIFGKQKQAFIMSIIGYTFSIGSIVLGHLLHWSFKETLMLYVFVFCLFYSSLLIWYFSLLKQNKVKVI